MQAQQPGQPSLVKIRLDDTTSITAEPVRIGVHKVIATPAFPAKRV